ncbi:hypothetical protein NMY22_g12410 [Coprinellus aureogranulatus]|nr:hypothetical protein NMY22_g12410 [Coprinellus aureogranulatus]
MEEVHLTGFSSEDAIWAQGSFAQANGKPRLNVPEMCERPHPISKEPVLLGDTAGKESPRNSHLFMGWEKQKLIRVRLTSSIGRPPHSDGMDIEVTPELVQELKDAVSTWRMQEYILCANVSFWSYPLTLTPEQYRSTPYTYITASQLSKKLSIATVHSQRWGLGRILFIILRYVTALQISINMATIYRTYFHISPKICKGLAIVSDTSYGIVNLTADVTLGLCLSALLGAKPLYLAVILFLCATYPIVTWIFNLIGNIQIPAQEVGILDTELGYPCYAASSEDFFGTVAGLGRDARTYINFARTAILMMLAIAVFALRYREKSGQLLQVLRRDGGLYYLIVTSMNCPTAFSDAPFYSNQSTPSATRFASAFVYTPAIISSENLESNPAYIVLTGVQEVIVPILAQRLLINMRSVDYMGSRPLASTLMFASTPEESKGPEEGEECYDMTETSQLPPSSSSRVEEVSRSLKGPSSDTNA